ncbi:primosomal replication protein N [Candidatus Palibaumannia cicadellinicola]|nr:primosomal replication protein N [Candidatus Baumannia cicadellinicola]MCJ7462137.1 primosomal replication protein N [Candidatus Baumannia cicadellinicola]MCJ7462603.1 primosomal replication protein N [Candidatus Baumannia cicadellinicola]
MTNRLILSGIICNTPVRKVSPSGIKHCQFVLEHYSVQEEAGFKRQAWCRISVVMSGNAFNDITNSIIVGEKISINGFISSHQGRNGLSKIVLHAEQIYLIKSGE